MSNKRRNCMHHLYKVFSALCFIVVCLGGAQMSVAQSLSQEDAEKLRERSESTLRTNIATVQRLRNNPPSSFDPSKKLSEQTAEAQAYVNRLSQALLAAKTSEKRLENAHYFLQQGAKEGAGNSLAVKADDQFKQKSANILNNLAQEIQKGDKDAAEQDAKAALAAAHAQRRAMQRAAERAQGLAQDDLPTVQQLTGKLAAPLREKAWFDFDDKPVPGAQDMSQRSEAYAEAVNIFDRLERAENYNTVMEKAESGNFPTLNDIEPVVRERQIKKAVEQRLKAATPQENEYDLLNYVKSQSATHANNVAYQELRQRVASDPELAAVDLLDPTKKATPTTMSAALAHSVARERQAVDAWVQSKLPDEFAETGIGAVDQFQQKFRTGLGTAAQHYNIAGEQSQRVIQENVDNFRSRNAAAHEALLAYNQAARQNLPPSSLSSEHYELLKNIGYIESDGSGDRFVVTSKKRSTAELYGSGTVDTRSNFIIDTLDTISGETATKMVLSHGASTFAASAARGVAAGYATDVGLDVVLDGGLDYITGKNVDVKKLLLDKSVQQISSGIVGQSGGTLNKLLGSTAAQKGTRKLLTGLVGDGAESLVEETILATAEGREFSLEQVTQNVLQNTFQKALTSAPDSYRSIEKKIRDAYGADQAAVRDQVLLTLEQAEKHRKEVGQQQVERVNARFNNALGADGLKDVVAIAAKTDLNAETSKSFFGADRFSDPAYKLRVDALATKLLKATERGELSFSDISAKLADDPNLKPVVEQYAARRQETVERMVEPARRLALHDIEREAERRLDRERAKSADGKIDPDVEAQILRWRDNEFDKAKADLIAPGSSNPTSDIDRSTNSEFVRSRLKELYRNTGALGNAPGATSARTVDVNEYINVFNTINDTNALGEDLNALAATGDYSGFSHQEAVEINSLRGAMRHMSDAQRKIYEQNKLSQVSPNDTETRQRLADKFERARNLLARTDQAIEVKREEVRQQRESDGLPALYDSDLTTAARDALYDERTRELAEKKFAFDEAGRTLDELRRERARDGNNLKELLQQRDEVLAFINDVPKDKQERKRHQELTPQKRQELAAINKKLNASAPDGSKERALIQQQAEIGADMQRGWGITLGDGIETYSSYTGLDAIVTQTQLTNRSIRDMISGKEQLASSYTPEQITNAIDDQIMMITHHMNEFNEGYEGATDAAKALGKYAERALLFVKQTDGELPASFDELSALTKDMVANRKDAEKLQQVMLDFAEKKTGKRDLDEGIKAMAQLMEDTLPGAKGLFDPTLLAHEKKSDPDAYNKRRETARLLRRKERERENELYGMVNGDLALAEKLAADEQAAQNRLSQLQATRDIHQTLSQYHQDKWGEAEKLLDDKAKLEQRLTLASLQDDEKPCRTADCLAIREAIAKKDDELRDIKVPIGADGNPDVSDEVKALLERDERLVADASEIVRETGNERKMVTSKASKRATDDPLRDFTDDQKAEQSAKFWSPGEPIKLTIDGNVMSARYADTSTQLRVE